MRSFSAFIRQHPLVAYVALTFTISWGGALLAVGGAGGMQGTTPASDPRFKYALLAMLAGPSVAGILMTAFMYGRRGLSDVASRLLMWRVGARWYAALLIAPAAISAALLALSVVSPAFLPGIFTSRDKLSLLVISLAVGVSAGIFEELGWTGFAIPTLRRSRGMVATGFIVGIVWSAWHLFPNIWAVRAAAGDLPMSMHMTGIIVGIFIGYLTAFRILMVWVYDATASIFMGMLMHVSITFGLLALNPLGISGMNLLMFSFAFAAALWIAVAVVALMNPDAKRLASTPAFRGSHGEPLRDSIAEVHYLRLGGVDQWVMIRGERRSNPALILLHGGPGFTETHFFRRFNTPLESVFTVVYWDQRGAGKSFDRNMPASSMTVEQFITDLDALVDSVRKRVGQEKVAIFGHSWGSVLGSLYASRFPRKVSAYIGCAQIGDSVAAEAASYALALAEAKRRNHATALRELMAIGQPPYDARALWIERTWHQRFDGQMTLRALWKLGRSFLGCPETSIADLPNIARGFRFTLDAMWSEVSRLNLFKLVPALQMPVFFFVSALDHWVPPNTSVTYFEALTAPSKQLVWFEKSGHEPFVDEPEKFNRTMIDVVRPAIDAASLATRQPDARHAPQRLRQTSPIL